MISERKMREHNAWSATGQRKGYAKPKLFSRCSQHGLTGLLGFGERLEGVRYG